MMFLNIAVAGFAALGAIPVIIHLLNKQRYRIIDWAAMQFLLRTVKKNSRRLQLRDLVLLALRTLALVLAALAAARPSIGSSRLSLFGVRDGITSVVVLDNSQSMGCVDGGESRFATAKTRARSMVEHLPKGSRAGLVLMSDVADARIPEPVADLGFVKASIAAAPLSDGGTSVLAGLGRAWDILKHSEGAREIFLVTDMQANAWPSAVQAAWKTLSAELASHPEVSLYVADVSRGPIPDLSVDRLEPVDPLVLRDRDCAFEVTVVNHPAVAGTAATSVPVALLADDGLGGELRMVASCVIDRLEGARTVRMVTRFSAGGRHRLVARIGPDHLEADNQRGITVEVIDHLRVLIIDGSTQGGYAGGAGFIRAALAPQSVAGAADAAPSLIAAEITTPTGIASGGLDRFQAVVLNDVPRIPVQLADGLKSFVDSGRSVIVFLGSAVQPDDYNAQLGDHAGLLPARLGKEPVSLAPSAGEPGVGFQTVGLGHPIMDFFSHQENRVFLARPRFFQAYALAPLASASGASVAENAGAVSGAAGAGRRDTVALVASFSDGRPALVERAIGDGSVLLFAGSLQKDWSDFALRPAFLMIMRRAVERAALSRRHPASLTVHDHYLSIMPAKDAGTRLVVTDPRGGAATIACGLSTDGSIASAEVPDTPYAGFYSLQREDRQGPCELFAANAPSSEAVSAALDQAGLRRLAPGLAWHWIGPDNDLASATAVARVGHEIWLELLLLAAACLVAESILAARWAPQGA